MIHSPSYRLRAPKSTQEVRGVSRDDDVFDSDSVGSPEEGLVAPLPRRPLVYSAVRDPRFRFKDTSTRGRHPGDYRYTCSRLPTTRHPNSTGTFSQPPGTFYRSKCYEPEKKNEIKFTLPEDTRISKLLRRLDNESDPENSLTISRKLLEVLMIPDNAVYVRKAFHILGDSMLEILRKAPGTTAKSQAARALGRMGYIMGQENDFARFQRWLFTKVTTLPSDICFLLMRALKETLDFESRKPVLQDYAESLMHDVVGTIEITDNTDEFKAALDVLMTLVELYPDEFYTQFRDTADLLFGWHVDHTQSLSMIDFISTNLQRIAKHFQNNLDFSITLIRHFFEDIENYASQLQKNDAKSESNSIGHLVVSILALNTVLKCLGDLFHPDNNDLVSVKFVTECLMQIVCTLRDALDFYVPDNLIIAGNNSICLLLPLLGSKTTSLCNQIYNLIDVQIALINEFTDTTITSMLTMISKVIKELSANLPLEIVEKLVGPQSEVAQLRHSPFVNVQTGTIAVYQSLLNLKNIPLLQEAYRYILCDLEMVYKQLIEDIRIIDSNPFNAVNSTGEEAEVSALFLLRCFSQLASTGGSIIGLWALKPSILELFGVLLQPFHEKLHGISPALQYAILFLLYSHCKCYNHFITSSNLVAIKETTLNMGDASPNSGNFLLILDVVYKCLKTKTDQETTLLLLNWLMDVLNNAEPYLGVLYTKTEFVKVVEVLIERGYSMENEVALTVCDNLEKLLCKKELSWNNSFLISVNDLCILHMNCTNESMRMRYTSLSLNIPWDITVLEFNKTRPLDQIRNNSTLDMYRNDSIVYAQHLHLLSSDADYGEMQPLHFKNFMKVLLNGEAFSVEQLRDLFATCWSETGETNASNFRDLTNQSRALLNNWATFESAQFCINFKLRTPLGKAHETFTSFDTALRNAARQAVQIDDNRLIDRKTIRMQLQFIEHLDKLLYNACEGCASAIQPPPKPVRYFYHTNAKSCREWFSRTRAVILYVALHAGMSTIALRHGQALLRDLVQAKKTDNDFERQVMYVTLSLLNLRESETLHGLYQWLINSVDKKFEWVKYAADQASRKYEIAAKSYKSYLQDNLEVDAHVKGFINAQIVNCHKELNNWSEIVERRLQGENGSKFTLYTMDLECADLLFNPDSFNQLNSWEEVKGWSSYEMIRKSEGDLYRIALGANTENRTQMQEVIDKHFSSIQEALQDNLLTLPSEFLQDLFLLHYISNGLKISLSNSLTNNIFLVSENFEQDIERIDSSILTKILWWSEYFAKNQPNLGFNAFCSSLRLHLIRRARKEKNYNLANLHVKKLLEFEQVFPQSDDGVGNLLLKNTSQLSSCSIHVAKSIKEIIKLLYLTENKQMVFNLCAATSTAISKNAERFNCNQMREISSKILLKLAAWLQNNEQISLCDLTSQLGQLLMVLPEIGTTNAGCDIIPVNEMAIGKLLQFSISQCSTLAKTFNAFATWCYRWGRKIVDHNTESSKLTQKDRLMIKQLLPDHLQLDQVEMIYKILSQTRASDEHDTEVVSAIVFVEEQLRSVPDLRDCAPELINDLVEVWTHAQKRVYAYYELSAEAYFKYLHLVAGNEDSKSECNSITATLRILRLIVKHALELQNVLDKGLSTTPTQPWKVIIPQLFSRLNHPEAYVRQRVSELLCRVALDALHLITFPAVVGAVEGGLKFEFSEFNDCFSQSNEHNEEEEEDAYESDGDETRTVLQGCFKTMVDRLSKQAPETIAQVQLLVRELRRITLLWDELWLGTLLQHHGEIVKRQNQLLVEMDKVNENVNLTKEQKTALISEKYRIITKPIVFILEQLQSVTNVEAETAHERHFQETYSEHIRNVLEKLKNPEHPDKPLECWQPLLILQNKFQQKAHKRTAYTLKMQDISPILANMKDTAIVMPGSSTKTTISHVSNHVSILPTKTKPKKLIFYGSDGKTYTYLFKGLEDLHLDERIMQFLSIANAMMAHNCTYRARHYSVIPLGPRSGLISWVDGTTPIFALYKRWQQRELAKASAGKTQIGPAPTSVLRPSEQFYAKLNPLLQEHWVKNVDNRKEWPLSVLKKVLGDLMEETPSNLLANELWCHSVDAGEWWRIVRNYSYSVAVMSIIGYIIGLGDRHLNNMLVDLNTGEVVHIDYNVCFEKGKTLRVPEKVPFRLTPNIVEALGVTGVEGIFRLTCENVLRTMKKGRETLLTLLEAFVYDPLVDWTVGAEGLAGTAFRGAGSTAGPQQTRKQLEREITLSMYTVRCTEMRTDWNTNRTDILEELPNVVERLNDWIIQNNKINEQEDLLKDLHQQLALVKEAEAHGVNKHSLYSLPNRYESYKKMQDTLNTAKDELQNVIDECSAHVQSYSDALQLLETHKHSQWIMELSCASDQDNSAPIFDLVKEFLQNAGQTTMILQCEQSENNVEQLAQQQTIVTIKCLHILQEYAVVLSQAPPTFREKHRAFCYMNWSKYLLETKDVNVCDAVFQQFHAFIENAKPPPASIKQILEFSYLLNVQCGEVGTIVAKTFDDLSKMKESNALIESTYTNAKLALNSFLCVEKDGMNALKYVTINDLYKQNKEYLSLEMAIFKSADYAQKYQSQKGGNWIFDDLVWYSNNCVQLVSYLLHQQNYIDDNKFVQTVSALQSVNEMYRSLQELYYSFHTIILPETMKKLLSEEPSVIAIITELNKIVRSVGTSLGDLEKQLEKQLRCIVMEMDVNASYAYALEAVTELRAHYQLLIQATPSEVLTQGKMLLMGFNGLFDKLDVEFTGLIDSLNALDVPNCWRQIDQVRQAKSIAPLIFNPHYKNAIDNIFFLKRLRAMTEFFSLTFDMCVSFKGNGPVIVRDDSQLSEPLKKFIANFAVHHCLGISTETIAYTICVLLQSLGLNVASEIEQKDVGAENEVSLDELIKKEGNLCLRQGTFTQNVLAQISSLQTNLKTSWNQLQEIKQFEQHLAIKQSTLVRLQNQITTHSWVHEDLLRQNTLTVNASLLRNKFVMNLRNDSTTLKTLIEKMKEARKQQKSLIASATSRLNWNAGVNPDVNQIAFAFEDAVGNRERKLDLEQQISELVSGICVSILQHELLRAHTPETDQIDQKFLNAWTKWQAACQFTEMKLDTVTASEESLMRLFSIDMRDNPRWVPMISEKISQTITQVQKDLIEEKENMFVLSDTMLRNLEKLRGLFTRHGKLIADMKPLIKSLTKIDECSLTAHAFINDYQQYVENFTGILQRLKKEITNDDVEEVLKNLDNVKEDTARIYQQVLELDQRSNADRNKALVRQEAVKDDATKGQQRNAYAMGVWRRVRLKLEGRDPDPGRKYTIQDQVDYVIREASSLDNLALLYEGWTPWV